MQQGTWIWHPHLLDTPQLRHLHKYPPTSIYIHFPLNYRFQVNFRPPFYFFIRHIFDLYCPQYLFFTVLLTFAKFYHEMVPTPKGTRFVRSSKECLWDFHSNRFNQKVLIGSGGGSKKLKSMTAFAPPPSL